MKDNEETLEVTVHPFLNRKQWINPDDYSKDQGEM